jgi:hypothetical protein
MATAKKGKKAKRAAKAGDAERQKARAKKRAGEAVERLDLIGAKWVAAIAFRVRELADEMSRLDRLCSHPEDTMAAKLLRGMIDPDALGRLNGAVEEAERAVNGLIPAEEAPGVPDLAGACRAAAEAIAAEVEATLPGGRGAEAGGKDGAS